VFLPNKLGITMPRKPRLLTEAGLYHIITRGNNRQVLFRDTE